MNELNPYIWKLLEQAMFHITVVFLNILKFLTQMIGYMKFQYICMIHKFYLDEEIHLFDGRYFKDTQNSLCIPFQNYMTISCNDNDEEINICENRLNRIKYLAYKENDNRKSTITLDEIINFCNLPNKITKIIFTPFPWKDESIFIIKNDESFSKKKLIRKSD